MRAGADSCGVSGQNDLRVGARALASTPRTRFTSSTYHHRLNSSMPLHFVVTLSQVVHDTLTPPCFFRVRLKLAEPSPSIALNVTIFNTSTSTTSTLGRHIATSGPYSDAISGVFIEKVSLQPGKYLVVPSTYKPGVLADFKLIVYSTVSGVQLTPPKQ